MLSQSRLKAARSPAWRELSSISSLTCFSSVAANDHAGRWHRLTVASNRICRATGRSRDDTRQ